MNRTPLRVAVVDDEESIRKAVERLLRSAGMVVETFSTGEQFLDAARSHAIDCVVLDLHMSPIDGFEVQAQLVRQGRWFPVIVMTGHDTPNSRMRSLAGGAAAYLLKPVDDQLLLDAIKMATAAK